MALENINQVLAMNYFGNDIKHYLIALIIFFVTYSLLKIFKYVIVQRIKELAKKTKTEIDDLIVKIIGDIAWPFYVVLSLFAGLKYLVVPGIIDKILWYVLFLTITFYVVIGLQDLIDFLLRSQIKKKQKNGETDTSALELLGKFLKAMLWVIAVILVLDNLGYDISALIAGLGIGGVAIAFALQNVLTDIFASFSIYFDKPFRKGDFIIIGTDSGTVERIGVKSTRIKTLQGEELVVSNKELTEARVRNFKKMTSRRVVFTFGVTYETSTAKLKKIPEIVKKILADEKMAELERVHFKSFGDFSLNYEVVYYVKSNEYKDYMDTQQKINLALKQAFEKEKIDFAYPTQLIYHQPVK